MVAKIDALWYNTIVGFYPIIIMGVNPFIYFAASFACSLDFEIYKKLNQGVKNMEAKLIFKLKNIALGLFMGSRAGCI